MQEKIHILELGGNNMPWSYQYDSKMQILEGAFTGVTNAQDIHALTTKFISLEKEIAISGILIDTTEMKADFTLMDVYDLPTKQYIEEGADRNVRVAVIPSNSAREKEIAKFYETVCRSGGWMVRTFADRQTAMNWLTGDDTLINIGA